MNNENETKVKGLRVSLALKQRLDAYFDAMKDKGLEVEAATEALMDAFENSEMQEYEVRTFDVNNEMDNIRQAMNNIELFVKAVEGKVQEHERSIVANLIERECSLEDKYSEILEKGEEFVESTAVKFDRMIFERDALVEEVRVLTEDKINNVKALGDALEKIEKCEARIEGLEQEKSLAVAEQTKSINEVSRLNKECEGLISEKERFESKANELDSVVSEMSRINNENELNKDRLSVALNQVKEKKAELVERKQEFDESRKDFAKDKKELKTDVANRDSKIAEMQKTIDELTSKNHELEMKLRNEKTIEKPESKKTVAKKKQ